MGSTKRRVRICQESDFKVRDSGIAGIGKGLFAATTIYRGDTIGPYTGVIITDAQAETEPWVDSHYLLWVCKDTNIVAEGELAGYTRYINHSDRPNARFVVSTRWKKARVEALKRIRPGEEVFLDYGPYFWEAVGFESKS
jgi:SET domain-containing protein